MEHTKVVDPVNNEIKWRLKQSYTEEIDGYVIYPSAEVHMSQQQYANEPHWTKN